MSDKPTAPRSDEKQPDTDMPSAGPHAKPELTNENATPGSSLPDDSEDGYADAWRANTA